MGEVFTSLIGAVGSITSPLMLTAFIAVIILIAFYLIIKSNNKSILNQYNVMQKFIDNACENINEQTKTLVDLKVDTSIIKEKLNNIEERVENVESSTNACVYI